MDISGEDMKACQNEHVLVGGGVGGGIEGYKCGKGKGDMDT